MTALADVLRSALYYVQRINGRFGACDTEANRLIDRHIEAAKAGTPLPAPLPEEWELYQTSRWIGDAGSVEHELARELTRALGDVVFCYYSIWTSTEITALVAYLRGSTEITA